MMLLSASTSETSLRICYKKS